MVNIAIIDDHELFRIGIREILLTEPHINDIVLFSDVESFLKSQAEDLELLLMDISLENNLSFEYIDRIKFKFPKLKIAFLSMHSKEFYILQAMEAKVSGYIYKDISPFELKQGIRKILQGKTYFSPRIAEVIVNNEFQQPGNGRIGIKNLTPREKTILSLIIDGKTSYHISDQLNISKKTVDNHRSNILKKLGFTNFTSLVRELSSFGEL